MKQHTSPCSECPWRRKSVSGWLGPYTPEEWLAHAHGETVISCHKHRSQQCAGAAIFRANVFKETRHQEALRLPRDKAVFCSNEEFTLHHYKHGETSGNMGYPKPVIKIRKPKGINYNEKAGIKI